MINFLFGMSVLLNIIFCLIGLYMYRNYKMKRFIDNTLDRDFW